MADKTLEIRCPHGTTRKSAAAHFHKVITHHREQYAPHIHALHHPSAYNSWDLTGRGFEARLEFAPEDVTVRIHLKSLPLRWLARRIEREARAALERELPVSRFRSC